MESDDWDNKKRTPKKNNNNINNNNANNNNANNNNTPATPTSSSPSAAVKVETPDKKTTKVEVDLHLGHEDTPDKKNELEAKKSEDHLNMEEQNKAKKAFAKLTEPLKKIKELITSQLPEEQKKPIDLLEIAFNQISEDLEQFREGITRYGCNRQTLWHFLDRLFQQIYDAIEKNEGKFKTHCLTLKESSKLADSSPEMKAVALYSTLKKNLEYINKDLEDLKHLCAPEDKSSLDEINRCTETALDQSIDAAQAIQGSDELRPVQSEELKQVHSKMGRLKNVVQKRTYRVIQVGLEKVGKSTWTNFLIGYDLVPSDSNRCTMIPTFIRNSEGEEIVVEVIFFTKVEFDQQMEGYLNMDNNNKNKPSPEKIDEIRKNYKESPNQIIKGKFEDIKAEFHAIIKDESKSYYCKQVIIYTNKLKSSVPVEIIDLPGFDSTIPSHVMMVLDGIRNADAFIFVTNGAKPSLTEPAVRLLTEIMNDGSFNMIKEKGFAILTHIDQLYEKAEGERCIQNATKELLQYGFTQDKIFPACPLYDLMVVSKSVQNKEKLANCENSINKIHTYLKGCSGRAKDVIYNFIQSTLPKSRCSEAAELVTKVKKFLVASIQHLESKIPNIGNTDNALEIALQNQLQNNWNKNHSEGLAAIRAYRFEVASKRNEIFGRIVEKFCEGITRLLAAEEAKCRNLQELAPQLAINFGYVNHETVQTFERERLAKHYNKVMESCGTDLVAEEIYKTLLAKYYEIYTTKVTNNNGCPISLEEIIPYEKCKEPVHTLIMRVAYPLAFALIQFSRSNELRPFAMEELVTGCPEFKDFFYEN